jgi:peroxiredoxin Q/BCP
VSRPTGRVASPLTDSTGCRSPSRADEDASVSKIRRLQAEEPVRKEVQGIERTTFVIDRTGRVAQIYPKVKVDGHIQNLLEFVGED